MLLRLKAAARAVADWSRRPVAWGAVLLSYVGIFAGFAFAVWTYTDYNTAIEAEALRADQRIEQTSTDARREIVRTGRVSIRNGCEFDNQRGKELRTILYGSINDDSTPADRRRLKRFARTISTRDCDKAARVLSDNPKEK